MEKKAAATTHLMREWSSGDRSSEDELFERIESQLRQVARRILSGRAHPQRAIDATELVNEAYLKLAGQDRVFWRNREHFVAVAALQMRRVVRDEIRRISAQKRGKSWQRVTFVDELEVTEGRSLDVSDLMDALQELCQKYPRRSAVVELRYFGGLSREQIAKRLDVSLGTVKRDWHLARVWLFRRLSAPRDERDE